MSGWPVEGAEIDAMIAAGRLQRVAGNVDLAKAYLAQARSHVSLASTGLETDAVGAFQLAYDAARKSLAALLIAQGLRPTSKGGHVVVRDAVRIQFGPELGDIPRNFDWMRRLRHQSEYPSPDHPVASQAEAQTAVRFAQDAIEQVTRLMDRIGES